MTAHIVSPCTPRVERSAHWSDRAACAGLDTELWFPKASDDPSDALAICSTCPVRQSCLDEVMSMGDNLYGIRGGLTAWQRRMLAADPDAYIPGTCKHCRGLMDRDGTRRLYHTDCYREVRSLRARKTGGKKARARACLQCGVTVGARKHYCPDCREARRREQLRENTRRQNAERRAAARAARQARQCSWCGLNKSDRPGSHAECAEAQAKALGGMA